MATTTLADLAASEAGAYLSLRGVAGTSRQMLLDVADGRPLTLALGADMVAQGQVLEDRTDTGLLVEQLVERFTSDATNAQQRRALNAAAVVRTINASLLARMLETDDAGALYRWLSRLSFMGPGRDGIFPHDQVRNALIRDMIKRYPGHYQTYVQHTFDWIVKHIEATDSLSWAEAARLSGDGMYAMRELAVVNHFLYPHGVSSLYVELAVPSDWPALADMIAHNQGAESCRWFQFWCQRAPQALFVVRDAAGTARGLFMRLDMETLAAADRDADPLTARLWRHVTANAQPAENAHMPFVRFWTTADNAQSQSPEKTIILMAINSYNLMARNQNLLLTAQVFRDSPEWVQQAHALGISLLPDSDTRIGDETWRIYYNDWQRESPTQYYYRRFAERCIAFEAAVSGTALAQDNTGVDLPGETNFKAAVADALKQYRNVAALQDNALLGSALVWAQTERGADENTRICKLQEQIGHAIATLENKPLPAPQYARILQRTYLQETPISQKQVAHALGIPFSTYRRRRANARKALSAQLWRAECAQR